MNAHHERATELLDANFNGPSYVDPNTLGLSIAQTEATLALAYEQRTANLIAAFAQLGSYDEGETLLGERMDGLELANEIRERLGF